MSKDTALVTFTVKDPDIFQNMAHDLRLTDTERRAYLDCGEYVTFELEIDLALRVVSGRIVPLAEL
jgi:hypothetical protein